MLLERCTLLIEQVIIQIEFCNTFVGKRYKDSTGKTKLG